MVQRRYELSDEQWDKIKTYFERKKGRPYKNLRNTLNGMVWILRSGASWRDLPSRYGDWNAVYKNFSKWQEQGLFDTIFKDLISDCDLHVVSIDSTIVKVHQDAGSKKKELIGKSRGGNTTKIHVATDTSGKPVEIILTAGQSHDITVAEDLIENLKPENILADTAYDSNKFRDKVKSMGAEACIKPSRNRKAVIPFDKEKYKERHKVECFFQKLKRNRRICTRYEKLAARFLACILIWLK